MIYAANVSDSDLANGGNAMSAAVFERAKSENNRAVLVSAQVSPCYSI